jgi:hypothetical protein
MSLATEWDRRTVQWNQWHADFVEGPNGLPGGLADAEL